jgi:hypothetical protein
LCMMRIRYRVSLTTGIAFQERARRLPKCTACSPLSRWCVGIQSVHSLVVGGHMWETPPIFMHQPPLVVPLSVLPTLLPVPHQTICSATATTTDLQPPPSPLHPPHPIPPPTPYGIVVCYYGVVVCYYGIVELMKTLNSRIN